MTDIDRGAYTPQTDHQPLAFDARMPRRKRPFPVTLVLSVVILLGLILALVFIYRSGVRGEGDAPQPVGDAVGAVREAAPAEAQPADPAASLDVYTDDAQPAVPVFTAPPETPVARPAQPVPVITPPAPPAATAPAPVAAPTQQRPVPTTAPAPIRATPAPTTPPVPAAPAPRPAPVRPAPAPTSTTTTTSASAGGSASAQIGAYNTREQAQTALAARAGGRSTRIEPVERNGTTLYRAMVLFPDRAAAQAFCPSGCIIR